MEYYYTNENWRTNTWKQVTLEQLQALTKQVKEQGLDVVLDEVTGEAMFFIIQ